MKLDEIKDVCDEHTSSMIDETVSDMLKFVQRYDSKEDCEFCKKHEATCFGVFTMGGVAYQNDSRFWVNPEEPVDPDYIVPIALKRYHRSVVSGTIVALRAVPLVSL